MNSEDLLHEVLAEILSPPQFEDLLKALADDNPTGDDLRYEGTYDQIGEARREDDPSLPQGEWITALKKADWKAVENSCRHTLSHRSKDLQIAAWLTEAWIHLYGFRGLYLGGVLLLELCRRYWDTLYPPLEGDDMELRLSPLVWINEKFFLPLLQVPVTAPQGRDVEAYNFLQRQEAWKLELGSREEKAAEAAGRATRSRFGNSVTMTPPAFFRRQLDFLQAGQTVLQELSDFLGRQCGEQAPSFGKLLKELAPIEHFLRKTVADTTVDTVEAETTDDTEPPPSAAVAGTSTSSAHGGPIRSRQEAYQRLAEAADYLLRTEPHSPTPYLVKRAVSWGSLSLQELLLELVNDRNDLMMIYQLLNIRQTEQE